MAGKISRRGIYIKKYKRYFKISEFSWAQARRYGITKKRWERAVKISKALKEYWRKRKEEEIKKWIEEKKEELRRKRLVEEKRKVEKRQYVAYVVWWSGKKYATRREIRVYFYAEDEDEAKQKGKELLEKAVNWFLNVDISKIKNWHGYEVSVAETTEDYGDGRAEYLVNEMLEDWTEL